MDIDDLYSNFTYVDMVRLDPGSNVQRWYRVSWEPTLLGQAVVRMYGRIDHKKRTLPPLQYDSLDEAWPKIRSTIQKRLDNGYELKMLEMEIPVRPTVTMSFGPAPADVLAALDQYEQLTIDDSVDRQMVALDSPAVDKIEDSI